MKIPEIDLGDCTLCGICVDLCPKTFKFNDAGYVEVLYPYEDAPKDIEEAIRNCRSNCISWKESP